MGTLSGKLKNLFFNKRGAEFYDDLEDLLIEADLGPSLAVALREAMEEAHVKSESEAALFLRRELRPYLQEANLELCANGLNVFLFLGVNGVGKTTSIAKLARYFKERKGVEKITAASGDTFRAAASEQLALHGQKGGFRVIKSASGGDPGAVVFDAVASAQAKGDRLVLADTAGRMHNKADLMNELKKIDKIVLSRVSPECYKRILVIDATTGQNGLRQAELFHEAVGLSGLILAKYDSTAKGGAVAAIGKKLSLPIYFVGTGESVEALEPFNAERYLDGLLQ